MNGETMKRHRIVWISHKVSTEECWQLIDRVENDLPVECIEVESYSSLFAKIIDPSFIVDFIVLDVDQLTNDSKIDLFEMLESLNTVISVCQHLTDNRPGIISMVSWGTPVAVLKQIQKMEIWKGWALRADPDVPYQDVIDAVGLFITGQNVIPPSIQERLSPQVKKKKSTEISLTPRQSQILDLVATRGASNKAIARTLKISESTVKLHMSAILKKYGCRNRTQLAVFNRSQIKILAGWLVSAFLSTGSIAALSWGSVLQQMPEPVGTIFMMESPESSRIQIVTNDLTIRQNATKLSLKTLDHFVDLDNLIDFNDTDDLDYA